MEKKIFTDAKQAGKNKLLAALSLRIPSLINIREKNSLLIESFHFVYQTVTIYKY
jgi:hypothetical protein